MSLFTVNFKANKLVSIKRLLVCIHKSPLYLPKKYVNVRAVQLDPTNISSSWIRVKPDHHFQVYLVDDCATVPQLFSKITKHFANKYAFGCRHIIADKRQQLTDGRVVKKLSLTDYKWFRSADIDTKVDMISKGFLFVGVKPKDIVMILAETRLEWMLSCQALLRIGSKVATLYATLPPDGISHGINETEIAHLITNYDMLEKLSLIIDKLPTIKCIVYMDGPVEPDINKLFTEEVRQRISSYSLSQIEDLGQSNTHLQGVDPQPDDTAVIMYTSGSTGVPKAVTISHKNLITAVRSFRSLAYALDKTDVYSAFLPMAHIFEMMAQLFFISNGVSIGYASIPTLTDQSNGLSAGTKGDLSLLKPSIISAVPYILDKIRISIDNDVNQNLMFKFFFNVFYYLKNIWTNFGYNTPIINYMFCNQFKPVLGGRLRLVVSGSAPLSPQTYEYIRNCFNVTILEGYGLTETCATATITDIDDRHSMGFVGTPLDGIQIKLVDWIEGNYLLTDRPNPRGELVVGGNNVAKGYFKNDVLTQKYFNLSEDGVQWFSTGDIAEVYPDGKFKIIDRKKDIIKLSKGEYIPLAKVEVVIKSSPFVDNVCVYGQPTHDYLIALIVPNAPGLKTLADSLSKSDLSFSELCDDKLINEAVLESIQLVAEQSRLPMHEIPNKIKLCANEWTPDNGLVTTALKLRRNNIQKHYQKDINAMFDIINKDDKH